MPAPLIAILGQAALPLLPHLLRFAHQKAIPAITEVLADPNGYASRIGDFIMWHGSSGSKVLAGLQSLGESQTRIENAVTHIEAAQIATNAALGSLQTVAFATLGITSLTGGLMLWRLQALNKRFDKLSRQLKDLDNKLSAEHKAHLDTAIQKLKEYDSTSQLILLGPAEDEAQNAANIYGNLIDYEVNESSPRLEVLNYRGRCYLLSLLAELRTRLLQGKPNTVVDRFTDQHSRIQALARTTFKCAVLGSPAPFLAAGMRKDNVSLALMTEIYQNAQRWEVTPAEVPIIKTSSDMFEYCREEGIYGSSLVDTVSGPGLGPLKIRLKYLMACFEDIARVESLMILAKQIASSRMDFSALQAELQTWQDRELGAHPPESVFAYSFA